MSGLVGADGCDTGAEGKAFKDLVEEDDDKERDEEGVAGNDEGEANDWGQTWTRSA